MANSPAISVELTHERDTKGTHVYKALDPSATVTSIYIRKGAFTGEAPAQITLAVTSDD